MARSSSSSEISGTRTHRRSAIAAVAAGAILSLVLAAPASADSVTATIAGAGGSTSGNNVTMSPDGSTVYTADGAASTISVIATATNTIAAAIATSSGVGAIVSSPDGSRLYATLSAVNQALVVDTATATVLAAVAVGNAPTGIAISPDGSRVYTANVNGGGSVSVIDTATNTVVATLPTASVRNLVVSPDGSRLYVAQYSPGNHGILVYNTSTNALVTTIATAAFTDAVVGFAFSPDGTRLYGTTRASGLTVIDTATETILSTIPTGTAPTNVAGVDVTPDGTRAYVTDTGTDRVVVVDLAAGTVLSATIAVGDGPTGVRVTPDGRHAYVNNATARTVSVIALDTFPTIITATLPDGAAGTPYVATIATSGSPAPQVSVTTGALPSGLTLDSTTGSITGTPTAPGSYSFTITASSLVSGIPSTATQNYTVTIAAVPPSAPLSLAAVWRDPGTDLAWSAPASPGSSPISGYRIERSTNGGSFTTLVPDTASIATIYTDTAVSAGQSYTYRVYALTAVGLSAPSNSATAAVLAAPISSVGTGSGGLAHTGFDVLSWIVTAAGLLIVGCGLSLAAVAIGHGRRRTGTRI